MSKHKKVIVFSGDVHYGFSSVLDYWKGNKTAPGTTKVASPRIGPPMDARIGPHSEYFGHIVDFCNLRP